MSSNTRNTSFWSGVRERRNERRGRTEIRRAIAEAGPAMRDELIVIAQRNGYLM